MKRKVEPRAQPRESPNNVPAVAEEIQDFLRALDSYPERFSKGPSLTFRQHLARQLTARETKLD